LLECLVDAVDGRDFGTSLAQAVVCGTLDGGQAAGLGLDFERVYASATDDEDVGNTRDRANRFQERGLDRSAIAAERNMEAERVGMAAPCEVVDDRALNLLFRLTATGLL
jgi:hypothetical protein